MKSNRSNSQKIGWIVFWIGAIYMLGLGWLYSWWMVPAANQVGAEAMAGMVGFMWALSVPLGAFIVAIGAALIAITALAGIILGIFGLGAAAVGGFFG